MLLIFTCRYHHRHYRPKRVNNRIKYKRKNNLPNIFLHIWLPPSSIVRVCSELLWGIHCYAHWLFTKRIHRAQKAFWKPQVQIYERFCAYKDYTKSGHNTGLISIIYKEVWYVIYEEKKIQNKKRLEQLYLSQLSVEQKEPIDWDNSSWLLTPCKGTALYI